MAKEVYRARKVVKKDNIVLCDSIVYLTKNGRQIIDSERDLVILPRYKFNKQGKFWNVFYYNTPNQCSKHYTILERMY